jgi:ribokinase
MTERSRGRSGRNRSAHPTIDDVARAAGVSKGTVSNVINHRVAVSPDTRARVERAIRALDFQPAETARALTARKGPADHESRADPSTPRLTAVGYVSVDFTAALDRLPEREERRLSDAIHKSIGGPAANVAAVAAGLGPPYAVAASLIAPVGTDQDSDWAIAELSSRKVDLISFQERRDGRMNRALVLVEADGRRTIVNEPSSLAEVDVRRFIEETDPGGLSWDLHMEGYQVPRQIAAMPDARARGFRTSMQATGLPPDWLRANVAQVLASFDVVVLHRESLGMLDLGGAEGDTDNAIAELARRASAYSGRSWPGLIAVTLGARGAAAITREGRIVRACAPVVPVVDTTGAGDAFVGAFLAAWLNEAPVETALALGCAAGSLQVTRFGAQEMRPSAHELQSIVGRMMPAAALAD